MRRLETKSLDNDDTTALMKAITPDRCQQELQEKGGSDFAIEYVDGYRFRCAIFKQRGSIGMVLRRIPSQFLTFEQIGMPEAIRSLIVRPRPPGVVGAAHRARRWPPRPRPARPGGLPPPPAPRGGGKTPPLPPFQIFTTNHPNRHIITLEDPIEYQHKHKKCTVNQREIGV